MTGIRILHLITISTTFSGCSGTRGLGVVDCAVVLTVVVVSGVGAGVVVGIRSPA